jgi:tetratricopeptide (TPR) repeat protein
VKISVWKKLLFAAITITALFATLEVILSVVGVRPVLYDEDPYVGFSSYVPLFVEETSPDGNPVMVTAKNKLEFFNPQRFAKNKPAGTYRIFCVGGSTTFGRPYDDMTSFCGWLRAILPKADQSRQWELINAGGVSYASYRVAALMEELVRYEPDMFIIYSGHNEFLERRTYSRIMNTPKVVRGFGAIMSRTRTYAAVRQAIDKVGRQPDKTSGKRAYLPGEVETILENSLGPEEYRRDAELREQGFEHYRYNLSRMVNVARSSGAKVILVTPASNLRHCQPFKSEHRAELSNAERKYWQSLFDYASEAYTKDQWDQALTAIDKAITIDDRHAHGHYLRGRVLWELKRYDQAKTAFERAMDEDVCPLRAPKPLLDMVMEVAGEKNVPVVDFVALIEGRSEHATPGEEWFLDHVHPTIEGNRQLALALLETMNSRQIVRLTSTWGDTEIERVRQEVERRLDLAAHGAALRNLSRLFRWAGKFEQGYKLGLQAIEMVPTDAEAHFQVAGNAMELGRIDEAISYYRQALQIEPNYARAHCGLAIALSKRDRLDEAVSHYRRALQIKPELVPAHCGLGIALHLQGKLDEAVSHYHRALRIDSDHTEAHSSLGCALTEQGKLDEAISHYRQALRLNPNYAEVHHRLGRTLVMADQFDSALEHLQEDVRLRPNRPDSLNAIAQVLIIHPDAKVRDANQAVGFAERAAELTEYRDASILDTLAAAYASAGQFDLAITTAEKAIALASAAQADELVGYLHKQLKLYREAKF